MNRHSPIPDMLSRCGSMLAAISAGSCFRGSKASIAFARLPWLILASVLRMIIRVPGRSCGGAERVAMTGGSPAESFGELLRRLRFEARLTQEELAEAASLSPRSVSDLERGITLT